MNLQPEGALFRSEVAHDRRQRLHGEVILRQPICTYALAIMLLVVAAAAALWVALGTYTRAEIAPGILVTDETSSKLLPSRPGQVSELFVRDGDLVRKGQRVATIVVDQGGEGAAGPFSESLRALDAQIYFANTQERLTGDRAAGEEARVEMLARGLGEQSASLEEQLSLQRKVVSSTQGTLARISAVTEKGFVSKVEQERREQALLNERQKLAQLAQQASALAMERRRTLLELNRLKIDTSSQAASAGSSIEALQQQRAQLLGARSYMISAPVTGRVTALQTAPGRTVDASTPMMTIVPDRSLLHAEIYAPSRAIGFVRPAQEVRLLYDAFPYQRFGSFKGRVTRISRTALDPREIAAPLRIEEAVYRIEVRPSDQMLMAYGKSTALQPGMTLKANIILDRGSFADWLLRPLRAVLNRNGA